MKKIILICLVLPLFPAGLSAQLTETTGSVSVMGGEYTVANNVWGGTTAQKLSVNLGSTYWKVILSQHNNTGGSPASYPFIWKGSHWGGSSTKNSPMPKQVKDIETAPFTWVIDTTGVLGTWNAAFECWIDSGATGAQHATELMIWMNYAGGAGPAGGKVASVTIGSHLWDVYYYEYMVNGNNKWNYIAYKIATPVDSVNLDLADFMYDALTRGYTKTTWYLVNMEAGFEIWKDGQGLTTKSYAANVIAGNRLNQNYSPAAFDLVNPPNTKFLSSLVIPFQWKASLDPNADDLEYIFHLYGPGIDTTIEHLESTILNFDGTNRLQYFTIYTWEVKVTDGTDTVSCRSKSVFRTPRATGVDEIDQTPNHFSLSQNFPNPFNPQTIISYSLPRTGLVTMKVYTVIGSEVATLINNEQIEAGNHEISFDAAHLPSGVYLYRLQSESFDVTKRMILLK